MTGDWTASLDTNVARIKVLPNQHAHNFKMIECKIFT